MERQFKIKNPTPRCRRRHHRQIRSTLTDIQFLDDPEAPFNGMLQCFPQLLSKKLSHSRRTLRSNMGFTIEESSLRIGYRLPYGAIPTHYTLSLKPHFHNFTFEGCVIIKLNILPREGSTKMNITKEGLRTITLNALDIDVNKVIWTEEFKLKKQEAMEYFVDSELERLVLTFDPPLPTPCKGSLRINFGGKINDSQSGFYRSKYTSDFGSELYCGVTRFEPTSARKCFPCWDEPSIKAKFDLSLIISKHLTALSNMPVRVIVPHRTDPTLHIVEFDTTPRMSTYLLAFVIGEFDFLEARIGEGSEEVKMRVYTPFGMARNGELAINLGRCFLYFYRQYFNIPYPLKKLDMVAVTSHAIKAMENLGLLVFRERGFLQDEENDLDELIDISQLVSREIAHQWLGNLVTMSWWTSLWLNEALVTFLEYVSVAYFEIDDQMWTRFVSDVTLVGLENDASRRSIPVEVSVYSPAEINDIFEIISYEKGASIIRMLEEYIGDEHFRNGLQVYLIRFAYGNASSMDLLKTLEEVSGKPVINLVSSWTQQAGFPLVRVVSFRHERSNLVLVLHQELFCPEAASMSEKPHSRRLWMIPIQISIGTNPTKPIKEVLMDKRIQKFIIQNVSENDWFLLNPGFVGFYRVKYPTEILGCFLQAIRTKSIFPEDRFGLLNELYVLASLGISSTIELLTMLEAFTEEDDYLVWEQIDAVVQSLDLLLQETDFYSKFQSFTRMIYRKIYKQLCQEAEDTDTDTDTSIMTEKLRELIFHRLLFSDHQECLQQGLMRFRRWLSGGLLHGRDFNRIVFQSAMLSPEDDVVFLTLIRKYRECEKETEKQYIAQALGFTQNEVILLSVLDFGLSDSIRLEDTVSIIEAVMQTSIGRRIGWDFFRENVTTFQSRFHGGTQHSIKCMTAIMEYFVPDDKLSEILQFVHHHFQGIEKTCQQIHDKGQIYSNWLKRERTKISDYLIPFENEIPLNYF